MISLFKDKRILYLTVSNITSSIGASITGIALPWLLIERSGGEKIYGYTFLTVTIITFFLSPFIGSLIDQFSRKKFILFAQVMGFCTVLPFAIYNLITDKLMTWQIILMYIVGQIYYPIQIPALISFTQEVFDKSQYKELSSLLETQNQVASMISTGIASIILTVVKPYWILFFDSFTYLISFSIFLGIPYQRSNQRQANIRYNLFRNTKEGFLYLKSKPALVLFFICSSMPVKTLQANANFIGVASFLYAIGAIIAGFIMSYLMKKFSPYYTSLFSILISTVSYIVILIPMLLPFLMARPIIGVGNVGAKIASNTVMMELIPNEFIGRVNSFINVIRLSIRVILITTFTNIVDTDGTITAFMILVSIFLLTSICIWFTKKNILPFLN
jgi:MFS family permease